jgi:hypothetical protein
MIACRVQGLQTDVARIDRHPHEGFELDVSAFHWATVPMIAHAARFGWSDVRLVVDLMRGISRRF